MQAGRPPPPPPTHVIYVAFFDRDDDKLTSQAIKVIELAARHFRTGGAVQFSVIGYGSRAVVAEKRANAVAIRLQKYGIPQDDLIVSGRLSSRAAGKSEAEEPPDRVEIVFP
jgi:outer membrane protein OmpA-like peptidoglycan-associated protein